MSRSIWITSDTHFGHANILNFRDHHGFPVRPQFDSVEEMNEHMVESWNSVVRPGDRVYHLGDVFFGSKDSFRTLWPRLAGSKRLILGNHDDAKFLCAGAFFKKVQLWRCLKEFGVILTHMPLHESSFTNFGPELGALNVHGHIHQNDSPGDRWRNVCVERTNYTPVNIEELRTT